MFWKIATFTAALLTFSSAAMAQSAVTVEQVGKVDPDKSMVGFKLPTKELAINSSPSGANITLIYTKGKFLSLKPVDGSKIVRCTTPCKYKLPQTSSLNLLIAIGWIKRSARQCGDARHLCPR